MNQLQARLNLDQINASLRETMRGMRREDVADLGLALITRFYQFAESDDRSTEGIASAFAVLGYANVVANMIESDATQCNETNQ